MFTTVKIHELTSISSNLSADDELIVYDNNTQITNKVSLSSIYNNYNESYLGIYPYYENRGYNRGEFCTYNNELYVCKNTIPAKSWDSSDWIETAICQELDNIKTNVSVNTTDIAQNAQDIASINTTLTKNTAFKRVSVTKESVALSAGLTVVDFTFTVPDGYTIVSACDSSYYAGYVASVIRLQSGSGSKNVTMTYYAPSAMTRNLTCAVLMLPNVTVS